MSERGNDYSKAAGLPGVVREAAGLAAELGFRNSCAVAYGPLLAVLAAQCRGGCIGESGSGAGVGTAWMLSGKPDDARIVTVERDAARAEAVARLYAGRGDVTVLAGDWKRLGEQAPFDLLFVDGGGKHEEQQLAVDMVRPGGTLFLDDLSPRRDPDPVREWWLNAAELAAVELEVAPGFGAIVAVRR